MEPQTGKVKTRLQFEEAVKKPPSAHRGMTTAADTVLVSLHREVQADGGDNSGVEAANGTTRAAEGAAHFAGRTRYHHKLRPYRTAARAEKQADRANLSALKMEFSYQNKGFSSNPYSRWQQKRAIKKEYSKAKQTGSTTIRAGQATANAARSAAEKTRKAGTFVARHRKELLAIVAIFMVLTLFLGMVSSCSVLLEGAISTLSLTTYPSEDSDMLEAEARYSAMEAELQDYLASYESTHNYDEYHFDLDEIGHDPYVLISAITAYFSGGWTIDEAESVLELLFDRQYTLTETVTVKTRYDSKGNPYSWTVCTVTLENFDLSHVPVYILSEDQLSLYSVYMITLGNRPDLFSDSDYVNKYSTEYDKYEIPPEALEDEQFAAMIAEAEKYLGYPYVWGGSSPSTSFDCSGFVSWVINNCGVGWSVGRQTADGLLNLCTRVSASEAQPGDLIFFQGTYDTAGASHVGIYVGNGIMLHCGDPIQYTSVETSYWQTHFLAYGRLPSP